MVYVTVSHGGKHVVLQTCKNREQKSNFREKRPILWHFAAASTKGRRGKCIHSLAATLTDATGVQQSQVCHYFRPGGLQCHVLVICLQLLDSDKLNCPGSTAAAEKPSCARAINRTVFSV